MNRWHTFFATAIVAAALAGAAAGKSTSDSSGSNAAGQGVGKERTLSAVGRIERIDRSTREVTIRREDGRVFTVTAPPEVRRFDELKVGDTVTVGYRESLVVALAPPGEPSSALSQHKQPAPASTPPGATMARQSRVVVKLISYDKDSSTVTFRTADGDKRSMVVEDTGVRKQLAQMQPGDNIQVTYTEAAAVSITPR